MKNKQISDELLNAISATNETNYYELVHYNIYEWMKLNNYSADIVYCRYSNRYFGNLAMYDSPSFISIPYKKTKEEMILECAEEALIDINRQSPILSVSYCNKIKKMEKFYG